MHQEERLDPELVPPLEELLGATGGGFDLGNPTETRAMLEGLIAAVKAEAPAVEGIETEDRRIPGPPGAPEVPVRVHRPAGGREALPALLWMHPGGYVIGSVELDELAVKQMAKETRCAVVSVEYRLAPEHPFPAALDDCRAALGWLGSAGSEIGVDTSRIGVAGTSSGGGLAAALALRVRDEGGPALAYQLLIYPSLDDSNVEPAGETLPDTPFWTRQNNRDAWTAYVGRPGGSEVSPYAAPIRAQDLSGLPPAYIAACQVDPMRDEDLEYARRLAEAGVPTELHLYPATFHAFDAFAPMARVSQRFVTDRNAALMRALWREP